MPSPFDLPGPVAAPGDAQASDLLAAEVADRRADAANQAETRARLLAAARAATAAAQAAASAALLPFAPSAPQVGPAALEAEDTLATPTVDGAEHPEGPDADPLASPPPDLDIDLSAERAPSWEGHLPPAATGPSLGALPRRRGVWQLAWTSLCLVSGCVAGLWLAPEGPRELRLQLQAAEMQLQANRQRIAALEQTITDNVGVAGRGKLQAVDRARHSRALRRYMGTLRRVQAQGAAELMQWFVGRWDHLLDFPQEDDRVGRRAAALSLLVGGMAENLNEGDFVPWQAEFLAGDWLGELHFDMDGDGLPGKRTAQNRHDGFANVSVCHIAMALNQSMSDGRVLVRPDMRCDRPEARMSVFLQGKTFDDALTEFVRAVREQGFLVAERLEKNTRLVLIGARPLAPPLD
jgi:hypothetical protein